MSEKVEPLNEFIDQEQYRKDISFSDHNLEDAFMQQAGLYAYYAQLAHQAQFQCDRCKHAMDILYARLDKIERDSWTGRSKPTEQQLSCAVEKHPKYMAARFRYNKSKMIAGLCREAADAFKHKKDMLVQVGVAHREERKGALRVNDKNEVKERMLAVVNGSREQQS